MKKKLTKIILAGAMVAALTSPMIADARGRGDGLGNGFSGFGFGAGSAVGPGINSGRGPQDDSSVFIGASNITGHSSGPGIDTGNKGSRLKDGTGVGTPAR